MKTFEIELSPDNSISIELCCFECGSTFSTELDLSHNQETILYSNSGVLYCSDCEIQYEYDIIIESNKLQLSFKNNEIIGNLKYSEKINWYEYKTLTTFKSKQFYNIQIERLKKILELKLEEYIIDQSLNRLVFTGVITSLETYLNEIFILIVFHSESTLEKFVSEYELYQKEKFSLHEIFAKYNSLEMRVREDLENFIYHNIPKLIRVFNIFNFELSKFEKIKEISKYIQKRHNFIHRSGLNENDEFIELKKIEVETLINDSYLFVEYINKKIEEYCFLPDYDHESPF